MKIVGLDPGLVNTGWGIITYEGNKLGFIASGAIITKNTDALSVRLRAIGDGLAAVLTQYLPDVAAIEESFVNNNAATSLKLGMARGVAIYALAAANLSVHEYPANKIKKTIVGAGHADKHQIQHMLKILLPAAVPDSEHAADALATAICCAHHQ